MAKNSAIEWTDSTFNPWIGCTKISPGCTHCYAEEIMDFRFNKVRWGPRGTRVRTSKSNWEQPRKWNRQAKKAGVRTRVFCASLADVFEDKPDQPEMDDWRIDLFQLIIETPSLDWLLLTKRPENVCPMIERATGFSDCLMWFPDNVWIGTSVENQEQADKRIPELLKVPAAVRFLSVEPLLGSVDLENWVMPDDSRPSHGILTGDSLIDWVIVGGESGPNARPMHPDWVRAIRDQCQMADVPFFMKQMYKKQSIPDDLFIRQFPGDSYDPN